MRQVVRSSPLLSATASVAMRSFWETQGMVAESKFMDRKDLEQIFPVQKPKMNAGEYGYQRGHHWGLLMVPNPAIRLPHDRRRLNPKPAEVVTVFGASGFLGAEICRELLEHPNIKMVRACTRYPTLIPEGSDLDKLLQKYPERIELHECDVTDRIQVNVASNGADTLIFAIDYHVEYANNSHFDVFVQGATNVGWTGRSVRAERVVYCTGLDATFAAESNYVDFRHRGEDACIANFPDATLLRFGPLYGKGYRYRGAGKFMYGAVYQNSKCQPTWVVDAARAVVRSVQTQRAVRMKLDLGGPDVLTHLQFAHQLSRHYKSRFVFPVAPSVGRLAAKIMPWVMPNAWFDHNYTSTWELDAINRKPTMFDRLSSWEHIGYKPVRNMAEAAEYDSGAKPLPPMHELDKVFMEEVEQRDKRELYEQETIAAAMGIHRAKAEPAFGRTEGLEMLAQEIYPGQQFRIRKLDHDKPDGAKYPSTVKNPHPVSIH